MLTPKLDLLLEEFAVHAYGFEYSEITIEVVKTPSRSFGIPENPLLVRLRFYYLVSLTKELARHYIGSISLNPWLKLR